MTGDASFSIHDPLDGPLMRVVSWNIEHGRNIEQAAAEIQASDRLRDPDALLVQELHPHGASLLAELLDMSFQFFAPAEHRKTGQLFGNAVLSQWPLRNPIETPLPHTSMVMGQKRSATSAGFAANGTEIDVSSVHLETALLSIRRREAQARAVADAARRSTLPAIVGGDFNSASSRSLRRFDVALGTAGFERITSNSMTSFRRFGREFALDHLYIRDLLVSEVGVETAANASDHKPVWAELTTPSE